MTRVSVLPAADAKEFDEPPVFNSIDRKRFYHITPSLHEAISRLRTPTNKVIFLVAYAYFKARKRFFGGNYRDQDIEYSCNVLDIEIEKVSLPSYSRKIRLDHEAFILKIFEFSSFNENNLEEISNYVYLQVKSYKSPRIIFSEIGDYLLSRKISLPRYRQFVNLISNQMHKYKLDVHKCITDNLDSQTVRHWIILYNKVIIRLKLYAS